jgi:RNAse (barnase) inhibitor barstar
MIRYLLENGADPTIKDKTGRDALAIALNTKRDGIVKILREFTENSLKSKMKPSFQKYHDKELIKALENIEEMKKILARTTRELESANNLYQETKTNLNLKDRDNKKLKTLNDVLTRQVEQLSRELESANNLYKETKTNLNLKDRDNKKLKTLNAQLTRDITKREKNSRN